MDGSKVLNEQYSLMLDTGKDSALRQLATEQPTQWITQYHRDRNSLDPNTRALVDRQAAQVAAQSLGNLRQEVNQVPMGPDGTPDFSSPQAVALKQNIERSIAVLAAAEKEFSPAAAAQIRGGFMPTGNKQLTERVSEAWSSQPTPARPATAHEERMFRTQIGRLDEQGASGGAARRVTTGQIDQLGKAVARGWITHEQGENILLTGRIDPATRALIQRDPKNDLYTADGRLISRGYDAEAVRKARDTAEENWLKRVDAQFEGQYPDDTEERERRKGQYLTQMWQQREAIMERHGFDPINSDPVHTAATINAFRATDAADNVWDKMYLGINRWWNGPMEEQAAPFSNEILDLTRELLPDQYGVFTLGDKRFDAAGARRYLDSTGEPADRAAVLATEGDDAALMRYVEQKIANQQGQ